MNVRESILKGAEDMFFHYGIKAVTMDDIANQLGISKRTIYENFPTKDGIINTILIAYLEKHKAACFNRCGQSKNAVDEIILLMQYMREMFSSMNQHILFELKKFYPEAWKQFVNFKESFLLKTVADNIKRGIKEGIYRKGLRIDILARLRIEQLELAWNPDIYPPSKYDIKDVKMVMLEHFLYGICNIKGYHIIEEHKTTHALITSL